MWSSLALLSAHYPESACHLLDLPEKGDSPNTLKWMRIARDLALAILITWHMPKGQPMQDPSDMEMTSIADLLADDQWRAKVRSGRATSIKLLAHNHSMHLICLCASEVNEVAHHERNIGPPLVIRRWVGQWAVVGAGFLCKGLCGVCATKHLWTGRQKLGLPVQGTLHNAQNRCSIVSAVINVAALWRAAACNAVTGPRCTSVECRTVCCDMPLSSRYACSRGGCQAA